MAPWHLHRTSPHETVEGLPKLSTTVIVTRTTARWAQPPSTLKRVASRTRLLAHIDSSLALQVVSEDDVSVVEPAQTASQPSNEAAASPIILPTSSRTFLQDTTLAHIYSESSVPGYPLTLYDRLAEAPTTHTADPYDSTPYIPLGSMEGGEFELPDISPFVQFALFACLGAGTLWSILVWLINLPLTRSQHSAQKKNLTVQKKAVREKETIGNNAWWKRGWGRQHIPKRTPADKLQDYAPLASGSSTGTASGSEGASTAAATSATPEHAASTPIRLRKLTPATKRLPPPSPSLPPWQSPTLPTNITPATHTQLRYSYSSTTPSSPANPFLPYPLQPRSSSEYLAAHHAFFSKPLPTSQIAQSSPHLSPCPSRSASPVSDLDDLEAQSDRIIEHRRSRSTRSVMHIADGMEKTGGKLWTAGWIGAVEEGVNKAVDAVVRWTEDEEGEEGLLLPIVRREVGG